MIYEPRSRTTETGRVWTVQRVYDNAPVLDSDGYPRIWFDQEAATAYARKRTALDAQSTLFPTEHTDL